MFDQPRNPPPAPDPGKAVAKALEADRKKAELAAAKKARAEHIAEMAKLAIEDQAKHQLAAPKGQATAAPQRGWNHTFDPEEAPGMTAPARPASNGSRPSAPRGFFSDSASEDD